MNLVQEAQSKHLFLFNTSKATLYATHPEDEKLDRVNRPNYKCMVRNGIYMTDDDREAEALRAHIFFGKMFVEDGERTVTDKYGDDQPLVDMWKSWKTMKLKSICNEKQLQSWTVLKKMKQEQLIDLMLSKKSLLEEYAII